MNIVEGVERGDIMKKIYKKELLLNDRFIDVSEKCQLEVDGGESNSQVITIEDKVYKCHKCGAILTARDWQRHICCWV